MQQRRGSALAVQLQQQQQHDSRQQRNHSPTPESPPEEPAAAAAAATILQQPTAAAVGRAPQREVIAMEDEDQLEIHLTFPGLQQSSSPKQDDPAQQAGKTGDEFVFVYEEEKRPIVVLLGWAGCQDKYLAKYSAIYEERSCITLRCTTPVEYLFWRRDRLPRIARKLVDTIREKCSDEHPVFFHLFSNGGAIVYQHISHVMQQDGSPLKVKGVIFDSSPGERRLKSLYGAISAIIGGSPWTNVPISFVISFFLSFIWLIELVAHVFGKPNTVKTDPSVLAEEPYSCPQIFLYSNGDTLIPYRDVEKFATRRAERGVRAQLVLFMNSPHVRHYATYPEVYVSKVCEFMNDCLAEQPNDQDEFSSSQPTRLVIMPSEPSNNIMQ